MNSTSPKRFFSKVQHALRLDELSPATRKILVGIVGGLVLIAGVAMILLPGPAFVVIPLGLAILASEFCWARQYLKKARTWFDRVRAKHSKKKRASETSA